MLCIYATCPFGFIDPIKVFSIYENWSNPDIYLYSAHCLSRAWEIFTPLGIKVTCSGKRHLGAAIGSKDFKEEYINKKVKCWVDDVMELANVAKEEPQFVYSAYIKGVSSRWAYFQRTIPNISHLFEPLEEAISEHLIPALVGRKVSSIETDLLALPARWGGLGIQNPILTCDREYKCSKEITKHLVDLILNQEVTLDKIDRNSIKMTKQRLKIEKESDFKTKFDQTCNKLPSKLLKQNGVHGNS